MIGGKVRVTPHHFRTLPPAQLLQREQRRATLHVPQRPEVPQTGLRSQGIAFHGRRTRVRVGQLPPLTCVNADSRAKRSVLAFRGEAPAEPDGPVNQPEGIVP